MSGHKPVASLISLPTVLYPGWRSPARLATATGRRRAAPPRCFAGSRSRGAARRRPPADFDIRALPAERAGISRPGQRQSKRSAPKRVIDSYMLDPSRWVTQHGAGTRPGPVSAVPSTPGPAGISPRPVDQRCGTHWKGKRG